MTTRARIRPRPGSRSPRRGRRWAVRPGLGVPGDPARPAAEREALAGGGGTGPGFGVTRSGSGGAGCTGGGGEREERAAGPVEVAGEDVEDVHQPAGQGAVLDGAAADAPVDGGGGGGGEFAGDGGDGGRVHVTGGGDRVRGEIRQGGGEFVEAFQVLGERPGVGELLVDERVRDGRQQQRVRAGPDRDVPVGEAGGAGAARVDDGEGAAAPAQGLEPAGEVGGGAEASVGLQRAGADQQEMAGAVEIRYGMACASPKSRPLETCLGIWSRVLAVNTLRVRRAPSRRGG